MELLIVVAILAVVLALFPMEPTLKRVLIAVAVILVLVWLLSYLGLFGGFHSGRLAR